MATNPFSSPPLKNPFGTPDHRSVEDRSSSGSKNPFDGSPRTFDPKATTLLSSLAARTETARSNVRGDASSSQGEEVIAAQKLRTALRVSLQAFSQQNFVLRKLRDSEKRATEHFDQLYEALAAATGRNRSLEAEIDMLRQFNVRTIGGAIHEQAVQVHSVYNEFLDPPSKVDDIQRELKDSRARCHDAILQLRTTTRALAESEKEREILTGQLRRQRDVIQTMWSMLSKAGTADIASADERPPSQDLEDSINQLHHRLASSPADDRRASVASPLDDPSWMWETGVDKNTGKIFWINHVDQTTSWQPPPSYAIAKK